MQVDPWPKLIETWVSVDPNVTARDFRAFRDCAYYWIGYHTCNLGARPPTALIQRELQRTWHTFK